MKMCLKNIEENKYQTNELTYLNTFLFLNNYPYDLILFNTSLDKENENSFNLLKEEKNEKKENIKIKPGICKYYSKGTCIFGDKCKYLHESKGLNENKKINLAQNIAKSSNINAIKILNGINYRGNIQYHKESLYVFLCMKETNIIEELHIYFDDSRPISPSQGYNFRLQIYSVDNEKDYELKSSKYFYDHNWKLVTKTYGKPKSSLKSKDLKDKYYNDEESQAEEALIKEPIPELSFIENQNNVIKINFKKWNNEFTTHYLYFELSISDGTKEMNFIPNMVIFPVLIGRKASTQLPSIELYDKF